MNRKILNCFISFVMAICLGCALSACVDNGEHTCTYGEWMTVQAAGCTTPGHQERRCAECGKTDSHTIEPIGEHSWGKWNDVNSASCTNVGYKERYCERCGEKENESTPTIAHVQGQLITSSATCINEGYTYYECAMCYAPMEETREVIGKKGHTYGEWFTANNPTCVQDGEEKRQCNVCYEYEKRKISATGIHEANESLGLTSGAATHWKTCLMCNEKMHEVAHDFTACGVCACNMYHDNAVNDSVWYEALCSDNLKQYKLIITKNGDSSTAQTIIADSGKYDIDDEIILAESIEDIGYYFSRYYQKGGAWEYTQYLDDLVYDVINYYTSAISNAAHKYNYSIYDTTTGLYQLTNISVILPNEVSAQGVFSISFVDGHLMSVTLDATVGEEHITLVMTDVNSISITLPQTATFVCAHPEAKNGSWSYYDDTKHCKYCSICEENVLFTDHSATLKMTTAPTCTQEGWKTGACVCGYYISESLGYGDHNLTKKAGTAESCYTDGKETLWKCIRCYKSYYDAEATQLCEYETDAVIPAAHKFKNGSCTRCKFDEGASDSDVIAYELYYDIETHQDVYVAKNIIDSTAQDIVVSSYYNNKKVTTVSNQFAVNNTTIRSITLPYTVTYVGKQAFENCTSLTTLICEFTETSGLSIIGEYAFADSGLTTVTLPGKMGRIDQHAFSGTKLTSITLPESDGSLVTVTGSKPILSVGDGAFSNCTLLQSVTFSGLTTLGDSVFAYCDFRTFVVPENITVSFGNRAFAYNVNLTSFIVEGSCTSIGDYFFDSCTLLDEVILSADTKYVGSYAFKNCTGLTEIIIPQNTQTVCEYVFYGCTALQKVSVPSVVVTCKESGRDSTYTLYSATRFFGSVPTTLRTFAVTNSEKIHGNAFQNMAQITTITLPYNIKQIGEQAFMGCSALTTIVLPEGLEELYDYAFYDCTQLTSITLPDSLRYLGSNVFKNTNLTYMQENGYSYLGSTTNPYAVLISAPQTATVTIKDGVKFLYGKSDGGGSLFAEERMFSYEILEITIPDSVVGIGMDVFNNCYKLQTVNISKNSKLEYIDNSAFYRCIALDKIYIPRAMKVYSTMSNGYDWVGFGAFDLNDGLTIYCNGYEYDKFYHSSFGAICVDQAQKCTVYYYSETEPETNANEYWHFDESNNMVRWG